MTNANTLRRARMRPAHEGQEAHAVLERDGRLVHLCCPLCLAEFERNPERYTGHKAA